MRVIGQFTPRGGMSSRITALYEAAAATPAEGGSGTVRIV